jgi:predicted methyltransferase
MYADPADPRTANVFDPSIRGKTDQFTLRLRKPA